MPCTSLNGCPPQSAGIRRVSQGSLPCDNVQRFLVLWFYLLRILNFCTSSLIPSSFYADSDAHSSLKSGVVYLSLACTYLVLVRIMNTDPPI
ncbi:hypothetical protein BKA93DRAFT_789364, partial [Sparassis latifolia]